MNLPPIDQIGFGWRSHREALQLLAVLYCDPRQVFEAEKGIRGLDAVKVVAAIYLHWLPYLSVLCVLGRLFLCGVVGLPSERPIGVGDHLLAIIMGLGFGLLVGLGGAVMFGVAGGLVASLAGGLSFGLCMGLIFGLGVGLVHAIVGGLVFGFVAGLVVGVAGGLAGGLASGLGVGLVAGPSAGFGAGVAFLVAFALGTTRAHYLPLHWILRLSKSATAFRRIHPVFWDRACGMPFPGLDRMLLNYCQAEPERGRRTIEGLITDYPSQRTAALRAKTVLVARDGAKVSDLTALENILAELPEGKKGYLAETASLREKALAVPRQQRYVDAAGRPHFKEQALLVLRAEIEKFHAQVGGCREPLASEFRRAAEAWLKLADQQLGQVQALRRREPTPQVFRAGDPVARDAEAFVPRPDLVGTIESEIMAGPGCPGLLVCGCRRLGKSTLIRNLDGFLPQSVMPAIVSMQNPEAFGSEASLAALLGGEIRRAYPAAGQISVAPADLATLFQFLQACNERLTADGRRLVLAIDEFEELDRRIGTGQLSADLPPTLRESIQSHRRITWVFAGTHHFSQLRNARWSSYLVSVRTVEVPVFRREETRLLLSEPLKYSRREQARQAIGSGTFGRRFWGEDGMDRIHDEAGGWPHLVQLLAAAAVDLCNQRSVDHADAALLDEAFARAVVAGDSVLAELMLYRSVEFPDAWAYLSAFRSSPQQRPPTSDDLRLLLKRNLLVQETPAGDWELRVPLMRRWLRERT